MSRFSWKRTNIQLSRGTLSGIGERQTGPAGILPEVLSPFCNAAFHGSRRSSHRSYVILFRAAATFLLYPGGESLCKNPCSGWDGRRINKFLRCFRRRQRRSRLHGTLKIYRTNPSSAHFLLVSNLESRRVPEVSSVPL